MPGCSVRTNDSLSILTSMAEQVEKVGAVTPSNSDRQPEEYKSTKDFGFLPIPQRLHYYHDKPPHFGLMRNIAFGLFSTFSQFFSSE